MPWADLNRPTRTEARWNKRWKRPDWFTKIKAYNKPLSRNFRSNWAGYWLTVCNPPYIDLLDIIQRKRSCRNFTLLERLIWTVIWRWSCIQKWSHTSLSGAACERPWQPTEIAHMGKGATLRRARTSLWWPEMNKKLMQFIDTREVCNAFQTKN